MLAPPFAWLGFHLVCGPYSQHGEARDVQMGQILTVQSLHTSLILGLAPSFLAGLSFLSMRSCGPNAGR